MSKATIFDEIRNSKSVLNIEILLYLPMKHSITINFAPLHAIWAVKKIVLEKSFKCFETIPFLFYILFTLVFKRFFIFLV